MEPTFVSATILLILITDPLGNIPLFLAALERVSPARRHRIIARECGIAFVVLLLFLIALRMIFPSPSGSLFGRTDGDSEPFIVPIAIPLIAGPSAMATVMLMATNDPSRMLEWSLAVAISIAVTYVVFLFAGQLQRRLGKPVITALERLMGRVLIAVSIEMLRSGLAAYWKNLN